jgi:1,4-dihydroxy-2-naphthoyl-CoA synthase
MTAALAPSQPLILRADQGAVAVLVLNDPAKLNALSTPMLQALSSSFDTLATDPAVRVVVIRAAGKAFCAGHDLKEIQAARQAPDAGAAAFAALFALCARVMQQIATLPKPVIAEVQGIATAAGCQLAATCDMVVASDHARFGVNGVNIGLFCSTPIVALSRKIPHSAAFELAATGEFLSAARAQTLGLANRVTSADALSHETMALAQTLAQKLPAALSIGKAAFAAQTGLPLDQAYAAAGAAMVDNLLDTSTSEGISAFLEKRAPNWA